MSSSGTLRPFSVCLLVADLDRSAAWYVDHLGFTETLRHDDLVFLSQQGFIVELVTYPGIAPGARPPDPPARGLATGVSHFCLQTDDLAEIESRVRAQGLDILFPFESAAAGIRFFFIRDFEGNLVQLLQTFKA